MVRAVSSKESCFLLIERKDDRLSLLHAQICSPFGADTTRLPARDVLTRTAALFCDALSSP